MTTLAALAASPALAEMPVLAIAPAQGSAVTASSGAQLSQSERETYRTIFSAIHSGDWATAQALLSAAQRDILYPVARAEYYLAPGSPEIALDDLVRLLQEAPDLPEADQIARLASARGLTNTPYIRSEQQLRRLPGPSRRSRAREVSGDAAASMLADRIQPLIVDDNPSAAEQLLSENTDGLSADGLTELRQRIAWSYYLTGDDRNARRLADMARTGAGDWAVHADWVAGLAAWRQRDCNAAAQAFSSVGRRAGDTELTAAGLYWSARAEMDCGRPENVQAMLRSAARLTETFYGMVAAQSLGIHQALPSMAEVSAAPVYADTNARRALALLEIGERALAGEYIEHGAALADARQHDNWVAFAAEAGLPAAQLAIAQNAPVSHHPSVQDRYPAPAFSPVGGWQVDRSLVYAHALQESNFRPDAVSHVGARGLMQLMLGTARDLARDAGESIDPNALNRPEVNIQYGQRYMRQMRDYFGSQAMLPKVIASYNAGPGAVMNWEGRLRDRGDPLLYIESIPFWETRGYVPIVLRNYWMYQISGGEDPVSLAALAQGMWPRFPGTPGPVAIRLSGHGGTRIAD